MQHVIIGTAGHIDHGKTTLVKALTGRETDTLREEKERGISINLGFTYFDLPSGRRAGIVDVPGHERFIKNMLAGIGGIDIVLLVVAADEGVMPQTREHLNILELLDIQRGIVVIAKKDLVDEEWLNMVTEDIKEELTGTFLEKAPIIPVSSITGEGIEKLTNTIDEITLVMQEKDIGTDFRIPVDRVFSVSGFGTVITGTLLSGEIKEGDSCEIYTKGIMTKVRGIQVHGSSVKEAFAGQRVAVNLANIKKDEVLRGDTVAAIDSMKNSMMIDCRLRYLKDAPRKLNNNARIKFYHGTSEVIGRVILLDNDVLKPGDSGLVQLRLEEEVSVRRGDKFVIRSYSPMITIGGGTILDPNPPKEKPFDARAIEGLMIKEKGDPKELLEKIIEANSKAYPSIDDIIKLSGGGIGDIDELLNELVKNKRVAKVGSGDNSAFIHIKYLDNIKKKSIDYLTNYHKINPLKPGAPKEEFRTKVFGHNMKQKLFDDSLILLCEDTLDLHGSLVCLKGFNVKLTPQQQAIRDKVFDIINSSKYQPPKPNDILMGFGKDVKTAGMIFNFLIESGEVIKVGDEIYMSAPNIEEAKKIIISNINNNGEVTAAQYRDSIGASRKYAVALLEYFDSIKLTKRVEDKRVLSDGYHL